MTSNLLLSHSALFRLDELPEPKPKTADTLDEAEGAAANYQLSNLLQTILFSHKYCLRGIGTRRQSIGLDER